MADRFSVRPFTGSDAEQLSAIYVASRRVAYHWMDPEQFVPEDFQPDTEGEQILVVESGHDIAGFSSSWMQDNFIHHLYLDPAERRVGAGSVLLKATVELVGVPARLKCQVRNVSALSFYRARGWHKLEEGESEEGAYYLMEYSG